MTTAVPSGLKTWGGGGLALLKGTATRMTKRPPPPIPTRGKTGASGGARDADIFSFLFFLSELMSVIARRVFARGGSSKGGSERLNAASRRKEEVCIDGLYRC